VKDEKSTRTPLHFTFYWPGKMGEEERDFQIPLPETLKTTTLKEGINHVDSQNSESEEC
jgi:hypothetical protein